MGLSINFYAGDYDDFKRYRALEDKLEDLYSKFSDRHQDVLKEFAETKIDSWLKRPVGEMPSLLEYEWMSKTEFTEWFKAFQDSYMAATCRLWYELPQLACGKNYWLVQWLLNRQRGDLVKTDSMEETCRYYETEVSLFYFPQKI